MFEYGSRVGFWRADAPVPGARAADDGVRLRARPGAQPAGRRRDPRGSGFDVCSHGWRWIKHFELTEAEEREHIRRAVASLETTIGERPLGWYCRYGPSVNTRRLVVEEGGFLYDSDYYGDELPFWKTVAGQAASDRALLADQQRRQVRRLDWARPTSGSPSSATPSTCSTSEGATQPKMMSVGLHMRLIGHPARAAGLQRLLDYMQRRDGVWVTRRIDIARHWIASHPYPGKGLNE